MEDKPWYKDGLRFRCTQCGDCCTGAPGYVWVNRAEIKALAARMEMSPEQFESRFVRLVGIRKSLLERSNGDCIFFDSRSRRCSVYEDRPRQCRSWPFWDSNIATAESWEETCRVCPGSGRGRLVPLEEVRRQAAMIRV